VRLLASVWHFPLEGRAPDLLGWICRCLEIFFLVSVLWWIELKTVVDGLIMDSNNKAQVCCAALARFGGLTSPSWLAWC
jgi:hypothetical protein